MLLPPLESPLLARGRCCPKIKKLKRKGKVLKLISFELEAVGGMLMLRATLADPLNIAHLKFVGWNKKPYSNRPSTKSISSNSP